MQQIITTEQTKTIPAEALRTQAGLLEGLGVALAGRGLRVGLVDPGDRPPLLRVSHPDSVAFHEEIGVESGPVGRRYLWSWGEPIGPVDDVAVAADIVADVLSLSHT